MVGREVSKQPPWSIDTSTSTEPGFIRDRWERFTSFGAAAPKLVRREHLSRMKPGSVLVDVSIDQGGCFETSRPTTHSQPTYVEEGVTHYCVANIPGAVARTSTLALTSATLPYLVTVAKHGITGAAGADPALRAGLSTLGGRLVSAPVAEAHDLPVTDAATLLV